MRLVEDPLTGIHVPREWLKYDIPRLEQLIEETQKLSNTSQGAVITWAQTRIKALRAEALITP